jgi:hypothetical protein
MERWTLSPLVTKSAILAQRHWTHAKLGEPHDDHLGAVNNAFLLLGK